MALLLLPRAWPGVGLAAVCRNPAKMKRQDANHSPLHHYHLGALSLIDLGRCINDADKVLAVDSISLIRRERRRKETATEYI